MNFDEAYKRLGEIAVQMDKSDIPLEKAVELYSEAAKLTDLCKKEIENARLKVESIENN